MIGALETEYRRLLREHGVAMLFNDEPPEVFPTPLMDGEWDAAASERLIRDLEAARGYNSYSTVGTEPRIDWLYRLGTVASRKGPYQGPLVRSLRNGLKLRIEDVRRGTHRIGYSWPPVYIDLFPTGDLNAMSVPAAQGYLVLVNTGLMNLVFSVLKIHVLSQRVGPGKEDGALLTEHQVELLLAESFNAYIYGAGSWMTWSLPPLQGRRNDVVAPTLSLCEDFVLGHEIGHVLAGDRVEPTFMSAPASAPVPGLRIPLADHEAEFAADRRGAEIVRAAFQVDRGIGAADERALLAGLLFFFLLDEVLREVRERLDESTDGGRSRTVSTHPAAAERMQRLVATFPPRHATSLTLVHSFQEWFKHYMPGALVHIEEVNSTIHRRDEPWWLHGNPSGSG